MSRSLCLRLGQEPLGILRLPALKGLRRQLHKLLNAPIVACTHVQ